MPTYDYRCRACGRRFEKIQRITEPAGADCPACGDGACERLITGGTFHLKGSGWYASDYGAKKAPEPVKTEAAEPAAPKATESDAKPAAPAAAPAASSEAASGEKATPATPATT